MEPFIGMIIAFGGNFAPRGWAKCDGTLLSVSENQALFSILGTTYGGDGRTTFGLPDLRGRVPMHYGSGPGLTPRSLGEKDGSETVTLNVNNLPPHNHGIRASEEPNSTDPNGRLIAQTGTPAFGSDADATMAANACANTGSGTPVKNMQPSQCINYIIALTGTYPSRN